ncbi:MAG TPA: DUF4199 domain-containing protein [Thermoanaerobaculia bacterium]|nr:DUF4199 domain-containing protein [Thermoanaerobaculia bacterium]
MKRTVLIFGLISGAISSAMMFLTLPLINRGTINFDNGEVIGYTAIFLSFLLVFFGIRSYRENHGGVITFGRAFAVGILITLISCVFYVASWEVIYFGNLMPGHLEKYAAHMATKMRAQGATEAAIAEKTKQLQELRKLYDNPLMNAAFTMIEPFPVGLIVTLVSAGILRKRRPGGAPGAATAAAAVP